MIKIDSEVKSEVCTFDNLYRAMRHCKKGVMWKESVAGYVSNGLANVYKLKQSLDDGTYKIDQYTQFKVYEPKERDIVSTRIKDRVFQRSFCDHYFYGKMTKSFIYNNSACQIGKGNEHCRKRLVCELQRYFRKHNRSNEGWVLKVDLTNYFGSTPHSLAIDSVTARLDDEWAVNEAIRVITSFNQGEDPTIGMGLGSEMTQLIELAILDKLDHFIKERLRIKHYIRYMDDLILIHEDKEYLRYCLKEINEWVIKRNLKLSEKKTQIFSLKQGIRFLGFRFRLTETGKVVMTLLPEKLSHERRKLRKLVKRVKSGRMTREDVNRCYDSWKAHVGNKKKSPGKRVRRDCHNLIICMDKYYKSLWQEG